MSRSPKVKIRTVNFRVKHKLSFGDSLYVIGDQDFIGNWDLKKAVILTWNQDDFWTGSIQIDNFKECGIIIYKYFIASTDNPNNIKNWEVGSNRIAAIYPEGETVLDDRWDQQRIRITARFTDIILSRSNNVVLLLKTKELEDWKHEVIMRQTLNSRIQDNRAYSKEFYISKAEKRFYFLLKYKNEKELDRTPDYDAEQRISLKNIMSLFESKRKRFTFSLEKNCLCVTKEFRTTFKPRQMSPRIIIGPLPTKEFELDYLANLKCQAIITETGSKLPFEKQQDSVRLHHGEERKSFVNSAPDLQLFFSSPSGIQHYRWDDLNNNKDEKIVVKYAHMLDAFIKDSTTYQPIYLAWENHKYLLFEVIVYYFSNKDEHKSKSSDASIIQINQETKEPSPVSKLLSKYTRLRLCTELWE